MRLDGWKTHEEDLSPTPSHVLKTYKINKCDFHIPLLYNMLFCNPLFCFVKITFNVFYCVLHRYQSLRFYVRVWLSPNIFFNHPLLWLVWCLLVAANVLINRYEWLFLVRSQLIAFSLVGHIVKVEFVQAISWWSDKFSEDKWRALLDNYYQLHSHWQGLLVLYCG